MSDMFDLKYYCHLYTLNMKSLIGSCKCDKFDALNSEGDSIDAHYSFFCNQVYPLMCINCDATFTNIVTPNIDYIKETGDIVNMFDYIEELNH